MASFEKCAFATPVISGRLCNGMQSSFLSPHHVHRLPRTPCHSNAAQLRRGLISASVASTDRSSKADGALSVPVQRRIPFLSTLYDIATSTVPTFRNGKRYGDVYETFMFGSQYTIVTDLEAMLPVFKDGKLYTTKDGNIPSFINLLGGETSLLALDGTEHMKKRSLVQPAFSPQLFSCYFEKTALGAFQLWDHLSEQLKVRDVVTLSALMKQHFLRLAICISTGKELCSDLSSDASIGPLSETFKTLVKGMIGPMWTPSFFAASKARDSLLETFDLLIRERLVSCADVIQELRQAGDKLVPAAKQHLKSGKIDILTLAIASSDVPVGSAENVSKNDLEDLGYLVLLLWFAGYTTQATTTLSAILEMHFCSDIKDKLVAEQEAIIREAGDDRSVTYEQVTRKMPLLDSYISEVLRVYPSVPLVTRKLQSDTNISGYGVKKGAMIALDIWTAQRDGKYYEDAESVKIDRFLGATRPQAHEIVAFGAAGSAHFCLGAALARVNMKITLSVLLRHFDIQLDAAQSRQYSVLPEVQPVSRVRVLSCKRKVV